MRNNGAERHHLSARHLLTPKRENKRERERDNTQPLSLMFAQYILRKNCQAAPPPPSFSLSSEKKFRSSDKMEERERERANEITEDITQD